jgi:hypothetical protein
MTKGLHLGFGVIAVLCSTPLTSAAVAGKTFDGQWSVLVITDSGNCDRAYRYPVKITSGKVGHADPSSSFNISGSVSNSGAVKVSVSRGQQRADGTGRISGTGGSGKWKAASGECAGHWTAEKRG